jgi:hypothetical protein
MTSETNRETDTMPIFKIVDAERQTPRHHQQRRDEQQAIAKFVEDRSKPFICQLHDEMPADRRSGEPGERGWYQPVMPKAARAILMKQIVVCGAYGIVEAEPEAVAA